MQQAGMMGRFYVVAEWVARFAFSNLIWLIVNIPIVFLFVNLLLAETIEVMVTLIVMLLVTMPLLFIPSITALSTVVKAFLTKEEVHLLKDFLLAYRQNYKKSMKTGGILALALAVLLVDFWYAAAYQHPMLSSIFLLIAFIGFIYTLYVCVLVPMFDTKIFTVAARCMTAHPILSLSIGIISFVYLYVIFQWLPVLLLFFCTSPIIFLVLLVIMKHE
ncbi:DUF624 domain-containing protein [Gracilibacillus caseinilyticus]|uniref:DUF624 domain-containing protein n=1 Tax=Gracilibacillus caseinilyticus TaxID=2932256 RepID=A0ABY4EY87_9BACI|nr:DUF624 domain-containing protein [Gracilibacillus caseinilyticus]UOQ48599.1 DUF624 domain-containing protein [Gracilibacillus caseinilyticus]